MSGGANTAEVVKAPTRSATLSYEQKDTILYEFDDGENTRWSNLPAALSPRKSIPLCDMSAEQQKAARAPMKPALSHQGYEELAEVREAHDNLAQQGSSGGGAVPPAGADDWQPQRLLHLLFERVEPISSRSPARRSPS